MRFILGLLIIGGVYFWFKSEPQTRTNFVSAVEKNLPALKLSELKHKDISLEKVKAVMASTFEGKIDSFIPSELMREMEIINQDWIPYRDRIYESLNLSKNESEKLSALRAKYNSTVEDLSERLKNASATDKDALIETIKSKSAEFDHSLIKLLGEERFQYLVEGRNQFNEALSKVNQLRPRISTNW